MSWDDVEVFASDALANYVPTRPIELIMAADECVQVERMFSEYRCRHPRNLGPGRHVNPIVVNGRETVKLNLYQINNVPVLRNNVWFLMTVYWSMGLCMCGRLYWAEGWEELVGAVGPEI